MDIIIIFKVVAPKICEKDIRWFTIKAKGLDILTKSFIKLGDCVFASSVDENIFGGPQMRNNFFGSL